MSQIQEAYQTLAEIDRLLADIELKITKITNTDTQQKMERTVSTFREAERLAIRWLALGRQLGLPEQVDAAITKIAQLVTTIRMLQISLSLMMATNPLTAAVGVAGLLGSVVTVTDVFARY